MNTPVSFELAKTLRLKGFNNPCTHLYFDGRLTEITVQKISYDDIISSRYNIAPTIAETVMWLYEKHGIWISIDMVYEEDQTGFWYCIRESKSDDVAVQSKEYNSPTEAYEAAIEYTLKNLIL